MKKGIFFIGIILLISIILFTWLKNDSPEISNSDQSKQNIDVLAEINDVDLTEIYTLSQEQASESSFDRIDKAYQEGQITIDQTLGYKLVAMFDHTRLPEEYIAGALQPREGDMILIEIQERWDTLTTETQKIFEPLFLDPSEVGAFFHPKNVEVREALIKQLTQL